MKKRIHHYDPLFLTRASEAYLKGGINRRNFLKLCAAAGIGFTSPRFLAGCSESPSEKPAKKIAGGLGPQSASSPKTEQYKFLKEMGRRFSGTTLRILTEDTPPANATKQLLIEEFIPVTGITVEWESLPLDRVLAKIISDTGRQAGTHDVFYLDQAWIGRFAKDCAELQTLLENKNIAYPNYDFGDLLQPLVDHIGYYNGRLAAIPFDIPIFITIYRKDIFDDMGLDVPATLDDYMDVVKAIHDAKAPDMYGTTASWKPNSSIECNMTTWLWGHGGSFFGADGHALINDEKAYAAMEYMLALGKYMAPGVTGWDWFGEADSFARGDAGIMISWNEYFPLFDNPAKSKIVGLAEAAPSPRAYQLRPADQCGFGEVPGMSHQGGSSLAISRYSKHIDAAWVLVQWATSADVTSRACVLSGAGNHVRRSNFSDERVRENATVQTCTTRHFNVVQDAILHHMGTEPHLPGWADLAVDAFALELGKMTTGQQSIEKTLANMHKKAESCAASI